VKQQSLCYTSRIESFWFFSSKIKRAGCNKIDAKSCRYCKQSVSLKLSFSMPLKIFERVKVYSQCTNEMSKNGAESKRKSNLSLPLIKW